MRLYIKNSCLILFLCLLSVSGCIAIVASGVGIAGGYAISRDTLQGDYDVNYSRAWKETVDVCGILGTVTMKDPNLGRVEAAVDRAQVKVEITQLTNEAVRLKVKARKGIFPRVGTAEKVFVKIVQQLMRKR